MNPTLEQQLIRYIRADAWMLAILATVRDVALQDCWIGAGFVRNKIWDVLHGFARTPLNDIDVIYFDRSNTTKAKDQEIEARLKALHPTLNWSVKNQARMHLRNGQLPYASCEEAISYWPETATAIAVRLTTLDELAYCAPYGLEDLFLLIVKPTPNFDVNKYRDRIHEKSWQRRWHQLTVRTE
ncbi:nucleotidyltransferase family protein [Cellulophaga baltica]|uniref:nucleotidyltransferase family protein n=1 Tax=Cellulophaga baltica TaxID=76594 RepID=UPI00249515D0|nr:nucleotidyltransferase family protein [Cellulophaga baltica]